MINAVREFFAHCKLPKLFASTILVLIPKIDNPNCAKNFRSIACCSTFYKCISKLICNRLSIVLPVIIHNNQGAFIKGRSVAYKIIILQDVLRNYGRKNASARSFLKVDLSKAYDTIS